MILREEIFCRKLIKRELKRLKKGNKIYFKKRSIIINHLKADGLFIGNKKTKKKKNALNKLAAQNSFTFT